MMKALLYSLAAVLCLAPPCGAEDPFGAPALAASPNCGPEVRRMFNVAVTSADAFVAFIKAHFDEQSPIFQWDGMDSFPNPDGGVDWQALRRSISTEHVNGRAVYSLSFHRRFCSNLQRYTFKMTQDGMASLYGCCGK